MRKLFKKLLKNLGRQQGFSLAEIMLVIAVLAILVTMTTPALMQFLRAKDTREEINAQLAIRSAIASMIAATGDLPADSAVTGTTAWYNQLARYTNLSPAQIQLDVWKKPRRYIMFKNPQTMLNSTVNIFYVTILSSGADAKAIAQTDSNGVTIVPVVGDAFADYSNTNWWKAIGSTADAKVAAFSAVGMPTGSDDIVTRFTDYPDKVTAYNNTLDRLNRVTDALSNYASARYAERVVACNGASPPADCTTAPPEKQIHYPWGYNGSDTTDVAANYNTTVLDATKTQNNSTTVNYFYNAGGSDTAHTSRRSAMINLVRLLGLPDDYCCSALEQFTDSNGVRQQMPFYYFSNPRARTGNASTPCATRPNLNANKLPARLTTTLLPDTDANATCG